MNPRLNSENLEIFADSPDSQIDPIPLFPNLTNPVKRKRNNNFGTRTQGNLDAISKKGILKHR